MKLYLDVCCLNRPFDDQRQPRVRLEAEAVYRILARLAEEPWEWVGSDVLDQEIAATPNSLRRSQVALLAGGIRRKIVAGPVDFRRAARLQTLGFKRIDALHVACAERAAAEVFLSTDDRLLRAAGRAAAKLMLQVRNPVVWLSQEIGS